MFRDGCIWEIRVLNGWGIRLNPTHIIVPTESHTQKVPINPTHIEDPINSTHIIIPTNSTHIIIPTNPTHTSTTHYIHIIYSTHATPLPIHPTSTPLHLPTSITLQNHVTEK